MKFSIITVCWNSAKTLPKMALSLAAQSCRDFEWIVIDGGSIDGTVDLVRQFDANLAVLISEPDNGIYDAMNKGVQHATGDYVYFLNSDDALHDPGVLADVAAAIESAPGISLWYGNVIYVWDARQTLRTFRHISRSTLVFEDLCHQAVFARRDLFTTVGMFNERFKLNADFDWLIRVFGSEAKIRWLDRVIARFSVGGAHARDPARLVRERAEVRGQYLSWFAWHAGDFARRVRHRWAIWRTGHRPGQLPLTDPPRGSAP